MCGIAGVVTSLYSAKYKNDVSNMLKTMDHRGPDATDYSVYDDKVLFGHNRLAIIDLSVDANQPFISNDGNYSIIFNGEIYNYKELRMRLKINMILKLILILKYYLLHIKLGRRDLLMN